MAAALGLAVTTSSLTAPASAAPAAPPVAASALAAPALAAPTVDSVRTQVAALDRQAAAAAARQAAARAELAEAQEQVRLLEIEVAAAAGRLEAARTAAGRMAAESYRRGSIDPTLVQVVLGENPDAVLTQASVVARLHERQALAVERSRDAADALAEREEALRTQTARLAAARSAAEAATRSIAAQRSQAATLLGTLQARERAKVEAARRAAEVRREAPASRSSTRTSLAPATVSGSCPPSGSRGRESGLSSTALRIMRCGLAAFPRVDTALGLGTRGNATDHDDGRAVDFMIPNYSSATGNDYGWLIAEWSAKQPGVSYVIWDQKIYTPGRGGWRQMENRGSDTANHLDHVHVSVN